MEISICALSDVFPERRGPRTNLKVMVELVGSFLFGALYGFPAVGAAWLLYRLIRFAVKGWP